ncbi:hypothetical protein BEP19_13725 [Ammoniphilus oxalaticus]|uniref:Flavoprotein n=1 Tax=Ammoniphilus oxalaticus TaxID=66863 RepID=A0A419SEX4_9BACL|nr:NAD(P)/FAD-dependent oxidoreductase [Ammoniphilus oxalaticus]RKD21690.1 hypothetical protein BEP19_13725 [Ammoniphilus oxalaticus]
MKAEIVIIGGGPAGLMAAYAAGLEGCKVLLVDKGDKLGRKLAISGGGRCNVTNAGPIDLIIRNIPGNGKFLYSSLAQFSNQNIIQFFESLGIPLKEEDRGRMFPVSDKAKDVVQALLDKIAELGVTIKTNAPVKQIVYDDQRITGVQLATGETIETNCVIVAVGGKSVPYTGSTGDGYRWAEKAGHTITDLFPTEVPITSSEPFIRDKTLQGLSLRDVRLAVMDPKRNRQVIEHDGDLIFTHFGISGPIALRCSQFVVKTLKKGHKAALMTIDLFPTKTKEAVIADIKQRAEQEAKRAIKNVLRGYLPERLIPLLLTKANLDEDTTSAHLPRVPLDNLAELIKRFPLEVDGTLSIEEAFVTGGGISLKEVDPKTMQSRLMPGLFFCGEVLDIHGYTGGFNITAAFTTGYSAGRSSAAHCQSI